MAYPIHLITSAPIEYKIDGLDLYDSFDVVARGVSTAPLRSGAERTLRSFPFSFAIAEIEIIFSAPRGQTLETANLLITLGCAPRATVRPSPRFDGIRFSLSQLMSKKQFFSLPRDEALIAMRRLFAQNLYRGRLTESLDEIQERTVKVLDLLRRENKKRVLCISHAFFLRIAELLIKNPHCAEDEKSFVAAFNPAVRPYEPLGGFTFVSR